MSASTNDAVTGTSTPKKPSGRPHNHFGMSQPVFQAWHQARAWKDLKAGKEMLHSEGGVLAMAGEGSPFLLHFRVAARNNDFMYVRLLDRLSDVDFAWPAAVDMADLGKVLEHWNGFNLQWAEPDWGYTQGFPLKDWKFASTVARPSATEVWFAVLNQRSPQNVSLMLVRRAGWSTFFNRNEPGKMLIGLCGTSLTDIEPIITMAKKLGVNLFAGEEVTYSKEMYTAMLRASADYTKRKLFTVTAPYEYPFTPHAALLGLDPSLMPEFKL